MPPLGSATIIRPIFSLDRNPEIEFINPTANTDSNLHSCVIYKHSLMIAGCPEQVGY